MSDGPVRQFWVFHAAPKRSSVLDDLRRGEVLTRRCVTQHARDVRVGDGAILWLSGRDAGVYAVGEVAKGVVVDDDQPPGAGRRPSRSCLLRWHDVRPEDPVLKARLLAVCGFAQARIVRQPMGGNPLRLTPEEWDVVSALL